MKFYLFLMVSVLLSTTDLEQSMKLSEIIPTHFEGWQATDSDETYHAKNLYDFIDGGAELYLAFGFKELYVRRFSNNSFPAVEVNLFDMGSAENAFGIFQHDLEDEAVGIGQNSEYGAGWLRFWKGSFFVYIFSDEETEGIKHAILTLGKRIADAIEPIEVNIRLIRWLPADGLIKKSLRYFHNHTILNYHYYLSNQNLLNLSPQTRAILGKYLYEQYKIPLLIVEYDDDIQAETAYNNFVISYLPEAKESEFVMTENGKWTGAIRIANYLIIVFDSPSPLFAKQLFESVIKNYEESKHEK